MHINIFKHPHMYFQDYSHRVWVVDLLWWLIFSSAVWFTCSGCFQSKATKRASVETRVHVSQPKQSKRSCGRCNDFTCGVAFRNTSMAELTVLPTKCGSPVFQVTGQVNNWKKYIYSEVRSLKAQLLSLKNIVTCVALWFPGSSRKIDKMIEIALAVWLKSLELNARASTRAQKVGSFTLTCKWEIKCVLLS